MSHIMLKSLILLKCYFRLFFLKKFFNGRLDHIHYPLLRLRPILPSGEGDLLPGWILFAAAEDQGRTEPPTERKRRKEREKGRVPKSQEIPGSLVTLGAFITLFLLSGWLLNRMQNMLIRFIGGFHELPEINVVNLTPLFIYLAQEISWILSPIFLVAFVMGIVGNIAQFGFLFSLKPLAFDFSRIKFTATNIMKKVLFSKQVGFNLVKTFIKVILLGFISYLIIYNDFIYLLKLASLDVSSSLQSIGYIALKLGLLLTGILLLVSVPDYFYQKHEFMESIKMTKQEVKEESKETEGDPLIKQRQKQKIYEMSRRGMLTQVKQADVVITNPTHFAVALRYDPDKENAPRVLAKGEDHLAFIIRNIAKKEEIHIIENKPLARELYYNVQEGQIVPDQFYRILVDIFVNLENIRSRLVHQAS